MTRQWQSIKSWLGRMLGRQKIFHLATDTNFYPIRTPGTGSQNGEHADARQVQRYQDELDALRLMQSWRSERNQQAATLAELQAQLARPEILNALIEIQAEADQYDEGGMDGP